MNVRVLLSKTQHDENHQLIKWYCEPPFCHTHKCMSPPSTQMHVSPIYSVHKVRVELGLSKILHLHAYCNENDTDVEKSRRFCYKPISKRHNHASRIANSDLRVSRRPKAFSFTKALNRLTKSDFFRNFHPRCCTEDWFVSVRNYVFCRHWKTRSVGFVYNKANSNYLEIFWEWAQTLQRFISVICKICGCRSGSAKHSSLLTCDVVSPGTCWPTFQGNLIPSSGVASRLVGAWTE